ncbi:MAG TPA: hypothetical protein DDY32_19145 [Desulfobulbaceae bacterium]|nr:hypothetical protein [Desulfobulbaceae bacterium]
MEIASSFVDVFSPLHVSFSSEGIMTDSRPQLSPKAFDRVVEEAIARIPAEIRRHLDNVLITVQPYPSQELLEELGFPPDEELFGVYSGVPLPERSPTDPPLYPDTIHIFQEPLEAFCLSREELIEEIEITIVHEIAHFVGFSDEELESFGYG